jgi:hypothetical protein
MAKQNSWAQKNPEKYRECQRQSARKRKMTGVPASEAKPGDLCAICQQPMLGTPHADHSHVTGKFRGWLCRRCNVLMAGPDSPAWLAAALKYKADHEAK